MFADSELPDFDSMTQEELIAWLEQLAKRHDDSPEFLDDYERLQTSTDQDELDEDDDWLDWRDETARGAATLAAEEGFISGPGALEPPVDLSLYADEDTAATASLDWLDEIIAAQSAPPDFKRIQAQAKPQAQRPRLSQDEAEDDPLAWLNAMDSKSLNSPPPARNSHAPQMPEDFDETWEDDETLDDLEDESLYSYNADSQASFPASLAGMNDGDAEEQSTQSMPPLPDVQETDAPAMPVQPPKAPAARPDSLTNALLIQEREHDLENWYAERLRSIAEPREAPAIKAGAPPPPGLAAAINSARGKVQAEKLAEALLDYETLLGTTAGLQWVVHDMRELIAQAKYRENASAHRVLGDALMRQGQLDAALNVYRHALSLL